MTQAPYLWGNKEINIMRQDTKPKIEKTDAEWREQLTPEQYRILREHGTERAFTGPYWDNFEKGVYSCAACDTPLFVSDTKFDAVAAGRAISSL